MKWLIVEDSLKSQRGHWFEYISGFCAELPRLGDQVTLLVATGAEDFITKALQAKPILPESPYLKMSDGESAWKRYLRIPFHACKTFRVLSKYLKEIPAPDIIFVPTVIIHHLLGWFLLIKLVRIPKNSRLLLFFPSLPLRVMGETAARDGSPTSLVMLWLLKGLERQVKMGKVVLGVETTAMKKAADKVFGIPFTYFPHPVQSLPTMIEFSGAPRNNHLTMACYGPARSEKGSDILSKAIVQYLEQHPESRVQFTIQWIDDFQSPSGEMVSLPDFLKNHPRVEIIDYYFKDGEYAKRLASTDVLLLPYRRSSYAIRLSRVVIEGIVNGIPVVLTRGTTLEDQAKIYGAHVSCLDENIESLINSITEAVASYSELKKRSLNRKISSAQDFSVKKFKEIIN